VLGSLDIQATHLAPFVQFFLDCFMKKPDFFGEGRKWQQPFLLPELEPNWDNMNRVKEIAAFTSIKCVTLVHTGALEGRHVINSSDAAKQFFKQYWSLFPGHDQERFVVACLDTQHVIQNVVVITIGTLNASLVHPREVFKPAILEGSSCIILSHNHPSGDTKPSREDHEVTQRLKEAGKVIGIDVLDHIIHGDGSGKVASLMEEP
jgi:DNA repair protein RadC